MHRTFIVCITVVAILLAHETAVGAKDSVLLADTLASRVDQLSLELEKTRAELERSQNRLAKVTDWKTETEEWILWFQDHYPLYYSMVNFEENIKRIVGYALDRPRFGDAELFIGVLVIFVFLFSLNDKYGRQAPYRITMNLFTVIFVILAVQNMMRWIQHEKRMK